METLLSIFLGIGLSAACGFRVFVPLLIMNIAAAALSGHLNLVSGFEWIGTYYAFTAFFVAAGCEVASYYIPLLDNILDTIATPAAIAAGTIATASVVGDTSPFLKWSLAIIAGGGVAGAVQSSTVVLRGTSTATTAGLSNSVLATGELASSIITPIISIALPIVAVILIVIIVFLIFRIINKRSYSS